MHDSNPTLNSEVRFWFRGKTSPTKADVMPLIESQPTMVPVYDGKRREGSIHLLSQESPTPWPLFSAPSCPCMPIRPPNASRSSSSVCSR